MAPKYNKEDYGSLKLLAGTHHVEGLRFSEINEGWLGFILRFLA